MTDPTVIVVGGGAAGIMAALRAAECGARVTLLEKTKRLGTKILISGGGKCNITHDGPLEEVLRAFRPNEARFIRPACYRFPPARIVEMLTRRGLEVYTRPDGRIFPVHGTAKDVVAILRAYLVEARVDIRLETPVTGLSVESGRVRAVHTGTDDITADAVIITTGGSSYPNSGTTGDAWPWAREVGHTVVPILAALAPMTLRQPRTEWSGLALRDCVLKARQGKEFARWRGDVLFTHHGISGPTCLGISREVSERMIAGPVTLEIDTQPDLPFEKITEEWEKWRGQHPKRLVKTWIEDLAPERFAEGVLQVARIDEEQTAFHLAKKDRNRLVEALKAFPLGEVEDVVLDKGEVVAGGVSLGEVDPQTMRSRLVPNLYWAGEALDIAGPVGGYNLQAAFATGYLAGEVAVKSIAGER